MHPADLLVVGIGAIANTQLAADAGLKCDNGIVVDETCRTSDPAIFAAGDCTNYFSPRYQARVRLESVDNAFEQSKAAALNILERRTVIRSGTLVLVRSVRQQAADCRIVARPRSTIDARRSG